MTGTTSGQTSLPTATESDDVDAYSTVSLPVGLQTLADKFDSATGHAHDAAGEGAPIGAAGIGANAVATASIQDSAVTAAKIANRTRSKFIPAGAFQATTGAPTFAGANTSPMGHWLLDAASAEAVSSTLTVPSDWVSGTLSIFVYLAPVTAGGAGNQEVVVRISSAVAANNVTISGSSDTDTFTTAGVNDRLTIHTSTRVVTVAAVNELIGIRVERLGADAADDLASDVKFFGVRLDYLADS